MHINHPIGICLHLIVFQVCKVYDNTTFARVFSHNAIKTSLLSLILLYFKYSLSIQSFSTMCSKSGTPRLV